MTLCQKPEGSEYHKIKCLNRECNQCGVQKFHLLPEESSDATDELVIWKHYAYIGTENFCQMAKKSRK